MPSSSARARACRYRASLWATSSGSAWAWTSPSWQSTALRARAPYAAGPGERLACVLPGLIEAPLQETDRAEPRDIEGLIVQRAHAEIFPERFLRERAPFGEAARERTRIAEVRRDPCSQVPQFRRRDRGSGPAPAGGSRPPGPLGPGTGGQGIWANIRFGPPAFHRRQAERLLPVAPALGELPKHAQGTRQPRQSRNLAVWSPRAGCLAPPRSAGTARPPVRSRQWRSRLAPVNRTLSPAGRGRRARWQGRGPAGPPRGRLRGLPLS